MEVLKAALQKVVEANRAATESSHVVQKSDEVCAISYFNFMPIVSNYSNLESSVYPFSVCILPVLKLQQTMDIEARVQCSLRTLLESKLGV